MVSSATGQAINIAGKCFLNFSMMVCAVSGRLQIMCFVFVPCSRRALTLLFVSHIKVNELNEVEHVDFKPTGRDCPTGAKKNCTGKWLEPLCACLPIPPKPPSPPADVEVPVDFKPKPCLPPMKEKCFDLGPAGKRCVCLPKDVPFKPPSPPGVLLQTWKSLLTSPSHASLL